MRDLKADLELCNKATSGPWVLKESKGMFRLFTVNKSDVGSKLAIEKTLRIVSGIIDSDSSEDEKNNGVFIAESREGWPEAINRAIAAEERVKELEENLQVLMEHIKIWADDEDGIPEEMYDDWMKAKKALEGLK